MKVTFLTVGHASFDVLWIDRIVRGQRQGLPCSECGSCPDYLDGDLEVTLDDSSTAQWPDVVGCGARAGLLVISSRVLDAWRFENIGEFPVHKVTFRPPLPKCLQPLEIPDYFWIDGEKMLGALLDFEASGFVIKRHCSTCGRRIDNIDESFDRRYSGACPTVFKARSWNGAKLFTTDLSPMNFFCTEDIMECARKYRHTNFRFVPIEAGIASWSKGVDYLGRRWPPHHPLRPSEGRTLDEWIGQLKDCDTRYDARLALLDLGVSAAPAVPSLIRLLDEEDEGARREAALLLNALGKIGVALGCRGESAAREHEERLQRSFGK